MNATTYRKGPNWGTRLLVGLVLILAGAGAAAWGLAHYQPAARFLGIVQPAPAPLTPKPVALTAAPVAPAPAPPSTAQISELQARVARVENATQRAEGFAGRADALVVAFAARRAIDRGVALGYLEPLLTDRFGALHQQAVEKIRSFVATLPRLAWTGLIESPILGGEGNKEFLACLRAASV